MSEPAAADNRPNRRVFCKEYHAATKAGQRGKVSDRKSRCPSWAADQTIQQKLIDHALEEPNGPADAYGRAKNLWNAVEQIIFVGTSCNMEEPFYNCYPEDPPNGRLYRELLRRANRSLADLDSED